MSVTLEIPAEIESAALRIPDLNERLLAFLRHQVELERWRESRYSSRTQQLVAQGLKEAEQMKAGGTSREEALELFKDVHTRISHLL
jgi:hypothetical protein